VLPSAATLRPLTTETTAFLGSSGEAFFSAMACLSLNTSWSAREAVDGRGGNIRRRSKGWVLRCETGEGAERLIYIFSYVHQRGSVVIDGLGVKTIHFGLVPDSFNGVVARKFLRARRSEKVVQRPSIYYRLEDMKSYLHNNIYMSGQTQQTCCECIR
jgi:hypothetical protein